jgi:hypothetical protein
MRAIRHTSILVVFALNCSDIRVRRNYYESIGLYPHLTDRSEIPITTTPFKFSVGSSAARRTHSTLAKQGLTPTGQNVYAKQVQVILLHDVGMRWTRVVTQCEERSDMVSPREGETGPTRQREGYVYIIWGSLRAEPFSASDNGKELVRNTKST